MAFSSAAPKAKKENFIIEKHNTKRNDHYFWLRDNNWPKIENKEIIAHLKEENKYTESYFAPYKNLQKELFEEMKQRIKEEDTSYPIKDFGYFYYTKTKKNKNHSIYCRKKGSMDAKEEVILDVNKLATDHTGFRLGAFTVSHKNNLLLYSSDLDDKERYQVFVKDLITNKIIDDNVNNSIGNIVWHESQKGFFYVKLNDKWRRQQIYFHQLGTNQKADTLIYLEKDDRFSVSVAKSSDKKLLFISTSSSNSNEIRYLDFNDNDNKLNIILERKEDQQYDIDHGHDLFYIKINDLGKNFRLAKFREHDIDKKDNWIEVIPYNKDHYLKSFSISKNYLLINYRVKGVDKIELFDSNHLKKQITFSDDVFSAYGYFPTYDASYI